MHIDMMKTNEGILKSTKFWLLPALGLALAALIINVAQAQNSAATEGRYLISGQISDPQGLPVEGAEVIAITTGSETVLAEAESQEDGTWNLHLTSLPAGNLEVIIERAHYESKEIIIEGSARQALQENRIYSLGELSLERRVTPAFWIATSIFVAVLLLIAFEKLHNTSASLVGLSAVFLVSYVGGTLDKDYFILDFERALTYINWEVIFLVMAMMIVVAVIEGTGIFQWMAFQAYRLSRGNTRILVLILMLITAIASALLDNFTTMLLMTPISLQIALAVGINPLALIIPEVLASNVGGISTLIGTPTNILIGAYAGIGFSDFLANQTAGVVIALVVMGGYVLYHYRQEWRKHPGGVSDELYERLKQNARLKDPAALWKSGLVFILVLAGFVIGETYHVVPAVPALVGATILLIWLKPDVHSMIHAVDWTTLVFFMGLFIVVGAVQEVGLMGLAAEWMSHVVGDNLTLGVFMIVFGVGTLSVGVANIPLAASMLPIVEFLSGTIPGAGNQVLYYALSMGAAMGGNGLLIGAEANLVTAGITEQAGVRISFKEFMKVGLPVTYLTLLVGYIWLLIRF